MAVGAYILIQTDVGQASVVAVELRALPGVSSANAITGPYDVIARAEADTIDELGRFVVARVQPIEGVTRTLTCPIVAL
jgi:DNA-binding Lrp family transcriptional regulator